MGRAAAKSWSVVVVVVVLLLLLLVVIVLLLLRLLVVIVVVILLLLCEGDRTNGPPLVGRAAAKSWSVGQKMGKLVSSVGQ